MRWKRWVALLGMILVPSGLDLANEGMAGKAEPDGRIEIPFKLYNGHLIIVKGTLGTLESVNILLDTGKSPTAVSTRVAVKLQLQGHSELMQLSNGTMKVRLEEIPNRNPGIMTAAGAMQTAVARGSNVCLGKENLGAQTVVLADVDVNPKYDFDGLLGFKELGFRKVWLDFEHGLFGWE